ELTLWSNLVAPKNENLKIVFFSGNILSNPTIMNFYGSTSLRWLQEMCPTFEIGNVHTYTLVVIFQVVHAESHSFCVDVWININLASPLMLLFVKKDEELKAATHQ
ncbi:hypothetical protein V1477_011795, partial [Vespula maculifrons]